MQTQAYETRLLTRRDELNKRLRSIEHDLEQPMNADIEERSVEREDDEVLESLGQSGLQELKAIDAALARIKDGTYGICVECGEPISPERLAVVPTAALCHSCAAAKA
tara:strand:- start:236 stop:559 length:324 start_codon:yes stop_codon:yes gene_type:complete